jgi:predicted dehydrogenase
MFRIGIVGSDNSHADAFSKLVNIPDAKTGEYAFPDCKVVGIYGFDKERTEQVARDGRIEFIAEEPEDLIGQVDAVMVVFRNGNLHAEYALPFIKAGIATWVDKPFTIKNEDAKQLIDAAKEHNTLLTGGSTCKYAYDVLMAKNVVENGSRVGKINTAAINFPATLENEYGGIYFYGAHLVEMTMAIFGYNPKAVVASENNGIVTSILKYEKYQVTMNFIPGAKEYHVVLFGENGTLVREIDISIVYRLGFEKFVEMLRTNKLVMPLENLYSVVQTFNAIVEAYTTKTEVQIN